MAMTSIESLGSFLARLEWSDIPAAIREKLRLHIVDTIGAWIAASHTPEGRALARFAARMRGGGDAVPANLLDEVATNCALARLSEVDDIHLASMTTPGSIVVPGALTLAQSSPDGSDVLAAIVAGYEAMIRLGLAINGPDVLYRGIWPTYFAAPFAMAAVASRLLRLDAQQTAHALALALALAAPCVGRHNAPTTSRWLAAGNAARNGAGAAFAAQSGFTSDLGLLDSAVFAEVYGMTLRPSALTQGLDAALVSQVSFKPWCAARQTMAATQALREVIAAGVEPDDIVAVRAAVLPPHLKMVDHGIRAGDRASRVTSLQYQMAVAALEPAAALDLGPSSQALSPSLQSFMARVEVAGDDALLATYPSEWPARISVHTRSGTREHRVTHVPGDPARPLGEEDISEKFRRLVAPATGRARAEEMFGRIVGRWEDRQSLVSLIDELHQICRRQADDAPLRRQ